jgi:periplasmic protein TonB
MLAIDGFVLASPRLPPRGRMASTLAFVSVFVHVLAAAALVLLLRAMPSVSVNADAIRKAEQVVPPRMVFLASPKPGGGGGGGGNRQAAPIRHAVAIGRDRLTLPARRVVSPISPATHVSHMDVRQGSLMLDAKPLASGAFEQLGLPIGGVPFGTSTGPGSGGGVGTGTGTGIGSGEGPGLGPGSGGGAGGGAYRPGGGVSPPSLISQVKPTYTPEAMLHRIQGSVVLQLVVTREGFPSNIRVTRSLDPGGLDKQAIDAVRQWRFAPGRLGGTPVDVLVTVVLDFSVH